MISIIIPIYNEEKIIGQVIDEIKNLKIKNEVIAVNDCSTDKTSYILNSIEGITIINNKKNLGYGSSIKIGVQNAKFDACVIIDGDGTYPVEKISLLTEYFKEHDMVIGNRIFKESKILSKYLRSVLKIIFFLFSFQYYKDVNSGLRIFSKKFVSKYHHICSSGFSYSTSLSLIHSLSKKKVKFIDINYNKRVGSSKVKLFKDAVKTFKQIIIIKKKFNEF